MSEPARENKASKANQGFDNIPKFLKILYQLLEDKAHNEHISWSHDGRAIAIKNPTEFAEKLLPIYFKHSNYSSFVRQLNLYSFRKKKHYPYDNTFAHTMFLKGRKDLLKFIKRKNSAVCPNDKSSPKIEAGMNSDSEINELVDENVCLKKVHQDMMEKMGSLEQALKDLNDKNQNLRRHYSKKKQSEEFLKKVVNKMAKVHGASHIREIIESFATNGFGHSLHLKPKSSNSLEMERAMSSQHNYPYDKCELYLDNSPRNYDYENDRNSFAKSNLTLPPLRTISSLSTNPDLNYPNDFYQNFDQEIDNRSFRQQNLASSSNLKSVLRGLDDFSYAGESRRDCFI